MFSNFARLSRDCQTKLPDVKHLCQKPNGLLAENGEIDPWSLAKAFVVILFFKSDMLSSVFGFHMKYSVIKTDVHNDRGLSDLIKNFF